jgi:hypothetical protein
MLSSSSTPKWRNQYSQQKQHRILVKLRAVKSATSEYVRIREHP